MEAIKSASLEIIRLAIFTAVSAFIASVSQSLTQLEPNTVTIVLIAILRFADKYIHKSKKLPLKGITPF